MFKKKKVLHKKEFEALQFATSMITNFFWPAAKFTEADIEVKKSHFVVTLGFLVKLLQKPKPLHQGNPITYHWKMVVEFDISNKTGEYLVDGKVSMRPVENGTKGFRFHDNKALVWLFKDGLLMPTSERIKSIALLRHFFTNVKDRLPDETLREVIGIRPFKLEFKSDS